MSCALPANLPNHIAIAEQVRLDANMCCVALYLFMVSIHLVAQIMLSKPGHMRRAKHHGLTSSCLETFLKLESGYLDRIQT